MTNCEVCGGRKWLAKINKKSGLQEVHKNGARVWKCWRCDNVQSESPNYIIPYVYRSNYFTTRASILYIDIESSLSQFYNYGAKVPSKYLQIDNMTHEYFIICWSASYVNSAEVFTGCVTPSAAKKWDDRAILKNINNLMHSADIIAGHNVDAFDIKKLNTRFLFHDLPPVIGKKTLDTLKIARQKFAFESNKLDYISQRFGLRGKEDINGDDWRAVLAGDKKTIDKILKYNKGDVTQGKEVLSKLMKWSGKNINYGAQNI